MTESESAFIYSSEKIFPVSQYSVTSGSDDEETKALVAFALPEVVNVVYCVRMPQIVTVAPADTEGRANMKLREFIHSFS